MSRLIMIITSLVLLATLGCAIRPTGPSVMVLPSVGLSLEQFSKDNMNCQQFARLQVGGSPNQDAINNNATAKLSFSSYEDQFHYDIAYIQCMYVKGHQVPVYGQLTGVTPAQVTSAYPPIPSLTPKLMPSQTNHNALTPTQ